MGRDMRAVGTWVGEVLHEAVNAPWRKLCLKLPMWSLGRPCMMLDDLKKSLSPFTSKFLGNN